MLLPASARDQILKGDIMWPTSIVVALLAVGVMAASWPEAVGWQLGSHAGRGRAIVARRRVIPSRK